MVTNQLLGEAAGSLPSLSPGSSPMLFKASVACRDFGGGKPNNGGDSRTVRLDRNSLAPAVPKTEDLGSHGGSSLRLLYTAA